MKNNSLIITILMAAFGLLAVSVSAEEQQTKEAKEEKAGPRIMKKFDADKDGKLSPEEKAEWEADKARKREERKKKQEEKTESGEAEK